MKYKLGELVGSAWHRLKKKAVAPALAISTAFAPVASARADHEIHTPNAQQDLLANATFGALVGGLGAWGHKKSFWKGARDGFIGGAVTYLGKTLITDVETPKNYWLGHAVANIGVSITQNAYTGKDPFDFIETQYGFLNVQYDTKRKQVNWAIDPYELLAASSALAQFGGKINLNDSAKYGLVVIDSRKVKTITGDEAVAGEGFGVVIRSKNAQKEEQVSDAKLIRHEAIHAVQSRERSFFNGDTQEWREKYHVAVGSIGNATFNLIELTMPYHLRPSEREAHGFDDRSHATPQAITFGYCITGIAIVSLFPKPDLDKKITLKWNE